MTTRRQQQQIDEYGKDGGARVCASARARERVCNGATTGQQQRATRGCDDGSSVWQPYILCVCVCRRSAGAVRANGSTTGSQPSALVIFFFCIFPIIYARTAHAAHGRGVIQHYPGTVLGRRGRIADNFFSLSLSISPERTSVHYCCYYCYYCYHYYYC